MILPESNNSIIESTNTISKSPAASQIKALEKVMSGSNVFITGGGGSGKSYIVRVIIQTLQTFLKDTELAITASTGLAALPLKGMTIDSWAGIRPNMKGFDKRPASVLKRLKSCQVLLIEEISMIDGDKMDLIEKSIRSARGNNEVFGGLQVVCIGDFCQLPPVATDKQNGIKSFKYAFESEFWKIGDFAVCNLSEIHRQAQSDKPEFITHLNALRFGDISEEADQFFKERIINFDKEGGNAFLNSTKVPVKTTDSIRLFATNAEVNSYNEARLKEIDGTSIVLKAEDTITNQKKFGRVFESKANAIIPNELTIKIGCVVILNRNIDMNLVNGVKGVIISQEVNANLVIQFEEPAGQRLIGKTVFTVDDLGSRKQYPICLAYALTIHKCQGMTLNHVIADITKVFQKGQAYVALSRVTSCNRLFLVGYDRTRLLDIGVDEKVTSFYSSSVTE